MLFYKREEAQPRQCKNYCQLSSQSPSCYQCFSAENGDDSIAQVCTYAHADTAADRRIFFNLNNHECDRLTHLICKASDL